MTINAQSSHVRALAFVPCLLATFLLAAIARPAMAQEALNMDSGTQPSPGVLYIYERARVSDYGRTPADEHEHGERAESTRRLVLETTLMYGITRDFAAVARIPLEWQDESAHGHEIDSDWGLGDPEIGFKHRVYKRDSASVDTLRAVVLGGVEIPSGDGDFSSGSVDPFLGFAATAIRGRHGFNLASRYTLNTGSDRGHNFGGDGPADAIDYDASYLFRLAPASWEQSSEAALYAVLELNGLYETNGDNEILLSPGLLLEARRWAGEVGVQVPIHNDVHHRPEIEWALVAGVRFIF